MRKRGLSFLLCLVMLVGLLPITAFAVTEIHQANITISKPIGGENPDISPASSDSEKYYADVDNTTVNAIWKDIPITHTVTFDPNGGTPKPNFGTTVHGVSGEYALPPNGITAPGGKEFDCWEVNGVRKNPGETITVTADVTVKALWKDIAATTYTISFDSNGGTGSMAAVANAPSTYSLPANGFTPPSGKQFKAWAVSSLTGEWYPNETISVNSNITLKAIWESLTSVKKEIFNVVATSSGIGSIALLYKQIKVPTFTVTEGAPAVVLNGQSNVDWQKMVSGVWEDQANGYFTPGEWRVKVKVYIGEPDSLAYKLGTPTSLTVDGESWAMGNNGVPTNSGGSSSSSHSSLIFAYSPIITIADDPNLQPPVKINEVNLMLNGYTLGAKIADAEITSDNSNISFAPINFIGMKDTDQDGKPDTPAEIGEVFEAEMLYAVAVNFRANDGYDISTLTKDTVKMNNATTVIAQYVPGENGFTGIYALEPFATYTVTFDANGGTGSMADATGVSGEYTLPANGFTAPAGKQFNAWSVGGVEKAVGDKITVTADTTVTAVWENIPAGHTCDIKPVEKVKPTCTEGGKEAYYKCEGCGKFYEDALGAKEITDLAAWGNLEKLGHTESGWKSYKDNHWKECTVAGCGVIIENSKAAHKDDNNDGKCDVCEYNVGTANKPSDDVQSPQTGDNSMMWLWVALLFVSGFGVVATTVYGKRRTARK